MGLEEQKECIDPKYQRDRGVDTYYPQGTLCFKDPSAESCPDFGSSGSGIVRAWAKRTDKKSFSIDKSTYSTGLTTYSEVTQYQYSFVGPLSMQKGCDRAFHMHNIRKSRAREKKPPNNGVGFETNNLSYRGENPLVATDARCFMPWIAAQYNMKLEKDYSDRASCKTGRGDKTDIDKEECFANYFGKPVKCDFSLCEDINGECTPDKVWSECRVLTKEGIAFNVNECLVKVTIQGTTTEAHVRATCFNNCKGVNPNAITAAGVALVALSGISSTAGLGPGALGIGGAILAGREVMNSMNRCGEGCCRMNNRCCQLVPRRGMLVCPRNPRGCRACSS